LKGIERLGGINLNSGVTFSFPGRRIKADSVCLDAADAPRRNGVINFPEVIQQRMMASADGSHELESDGGTHGFSGKPLNENLGLRI
jgi:hypothetical protein